MAKRGKVVASVLPRMGIGTVSFIHFIHSLNDFLQPGPSTGGRILDTALPRFSHAKIPERPPFPPELDCPLAA